MGRIGASKPRAVSENKKKDAIQEPLAPAETQGGSAMIRYLPCKHWDLSSSPSTHVKRLDMVVCAAEMGRSLGLIGR